MSMTVSQLITLLQAAQTASGDAAVSVLIPTYDMGVDITDVSMPTPGSTDPIRIVTQSPI